MKPLPLHRFRATAPIQSTQGTTHCEDDDEFNDIQGQECCRYLIDQASTSLALIAYLRASLLAELAIFSSFSFSAL